MENEAWVLPASVAVLSGFAAFLLFAASLYFMAHRSRNRVRQGVAPIAAQSDPRTAFLFDDEVLIDATPAARQLLSLSQRGGTCWARLMAILRSRFPQIEERLVELMDRGSISITSEDGRSLLQAEWYEGLARLQLQDVVSGKGEGEVQLDRLSLEAMQEEVDLFRKLATRFPYPTWLESPDGRVIWADTAYLDLADQIEGHSGFPVWPPPRLFPDVAMDTTTRLPLSLGSSKPSWFEIDHRKMDHLHLKVAVPADHVVAAETSRLALLQTLTKTFASLSVGLAVFDKSRHLVMFNPALAELLGLPSDVLARRPSIDTFLEMLRDNRILPEPRDFSSWKQALLRAVTEAERGTLAETWALPDGRTFEVNGRPVEDGAIAFVIHDISDGVRLTRQFRSDLTLHQDILDRLDEPMVIFGPDGSLFSANTAYRRLWGTKAEAGAAEAQKVWQSQCPDAEFWDIDDPSGDGASLSGRLSDGRKVLARLLPLPAGATLIRFSIAGLQPMAVAAQRGA